MFNRIAKAPKAPLQQLSRSIYIRGDETQFATANANLDRKAQAKNYPLSQVSTLQNGLRVATEATTGEMATVGVFVDAGSRYETAKNNGVAHFLEHTLFKGTGKRTRVQLEKEIENIGGQLNAYTSREQTVFYAKVFKKDVNQALDILSDIILNSKITEATVEAERSVILREMEDVESRMQEVIFDRLHQTAYRTSDLGRTILGPVENIKKITKQDIDTYIKSHYVAPRIVVAAAGDIDHAQFAASAEKYFSGVPTTAPNGIKAVKAPGHFIGSEIRIRDDDMPAAHVAVAYETAGWNDPDHYPLMVLQMMLGSYNSTNTSAVYSSSPIVNDVALHEQAESVTPFNTVYSDTGLFGFYYVADCMNLDILARSVGYGFTSHAYNVSEVRLEEAKNKLKLSLFNQLEGSTAVCEELGRQLLTYNRRIHPVEMMARIDAVDVMAVQKVMKRFFYDQDPAIAAIGPILELPDYTFMRKHSFSVFL